MSAHKGFDAENGTPHTRSELQQWIHARMHLPVDEEQALLEAIDGVLVKHERLWQQSKEDAIQAISGGFSDRMNRLRAELAARNATVTSIGRYFEDLVTDLTDQTHLDPKTRLMNFRSFLAQVEAFLALEQRGRWCALGLVDINSFKWYNDTLGHVAGDKIIDRVARLLREQVRSDDLITKETPSARNGQDLHARFGGDEFCFLIPGLDERSAAYDIAERFRHAVQRHDWTMVDPRLAERPVRVDVGIVCLMLTDVRERRPIVRRLAQDLLDHADRLMYEAKQARADRVHPLSVRLVQGQLVELDDPPPPAESSDATNTARAT